MNMHPLPPLKIRCLNPQARLVPAPGVDVMVTVNKIKKSDYIWSNPTTKKGHECYVRYDDRGNGWCCDDSPESYECTPVVNLIDLQKKIKEVMKTSQTKGR